MNVSEESEEGVPTSKLHLSWEHSHHSKAESLEQERTSSPVPRCVSMTSERSIDLPEDFKDGKQYTEQRSEHHEASDTTVPSQVFVKSDRSIGLPPTFKDERPSTEERSEQQERSDTTVSSRVSIKSDSSIGLPENFKDGNNFTEQRSEHHEVSDTTVPSQVFVKSDRSIGLPPTFKDERPSTEERQHKKSSKETSDISELWPATNQSDTKTNFMLVKATVQTFVDQELVKLSGAHFPEYPQCSGSQVKDDVGEGDDEEALDEEEEQQRKSAIKGVGKITLLCMMRMKEDEMAHTLKSGCRPAWIAVKLWLSAPTALV